MRLACAFAFGLLLTAFAASAQQPSWTTAVDGKSLGDFDRVGVANWRVEDGAIVADKKEGAANAYLVTKTSYKDFHIHAEFWVDEAANSGIFIRCSDPKQISSRLCYEVNIYDKRPDPTYGTGAIVNVGAVNPMPKAAGKWNTYDIIAQGPHLVVILNGQKTVDAQDGKLSAGPFALQYGSGVVKFRKVLVRPL